MRLIIVVTLVHLLCFVRVSQLRHVVPLSNSASTARTGVKTTETADVNGAARSSMYCVGLSCHQVYSTLLRYTNTVIVSRPEHIAAARAVAAENAIPGI